MGYLRWSFPVCLFVCLQVVWLVELFCEKIICVLVCSQDVQWNDIDYMDQFMDFTFDSTKFATLPDLVKDLHAHDQRYVMILVRRSLYRFYNVCCVLFGVFVWLLCLNLQDPGISSTQPEGSYWPFDEGLRRDVFIKDAEGKTLIGKVIPDPTKHKWDYLKTQFLLSPLSFTEVNLQRVWVINSSMCPSRCGLVWQRILISLMMWHMNGGMTTFRGSMTRSHLMDYGLWVWKSTIIWKNQR